MLQAGIELVGAPGPEGTAEALTVLCEALEAAGLENWRIGLGDASLYPRLLDRVGVPEGARPQILHELVTRDYVGLAREVEAFGAPELLELPQRRGGPEMLDAPETEPLAALHGLLPEAGGRSGSSSTSASRGRSPTTRARCSRSTTPRSGRRSAAAGATTTCSGASGARCPRAAGRSTSSGCTPRAWGRAE